MLISLLHRLLVAVLLIIPLHVHALGTPRTGLHHMDIFHATVDHSAQVIIELDTFCNCPDLVTVTIDIVLLTDERYEYQFKDTFILNQTRLLSFTLLPFMSLDDHRSISLQIESEDAVEAQLQNYIYTISPQPTSEEIVSFGETLTLPQPTRTRINWNGSIVHSYDQFTLESDENNDISSPVVPLTQWAVTIDSIMNQPERIAATVVLSSGSFEHDIIEDVTLIRTSEDHYMITPLFISSYLPSTTTPQENQHDNVFDLVITIPVTIPIDVHFELHVHAFSQGRSRIIVEDDWHWSEPLFGVCSQSYYCFHRATTPIMGDVNVYHSFTLEAPS